jgi:hypothetical protein
MSEIQYKLDPVEAARLFERGSAAARGGQRRMAVGLLSRAVQCDPQHEQAWLWLSGVLDDPNQVAFCLRSVLSINPNNERARQGLAWLEQRKLGINPTAPFVAPPPSETTNGSNGAAAVTRPQPTTSPASGAEDEKHESWWVHFRHTRREFTRAKRVMWWALTIAPMLLLGLTLALNVALRDTVEQRLEAVRLAAIPTATALPEDPNAPQTTPTPQPILRDATRETDDLLSLAYLNQIEPLREQLRAATDAYREATSKPGNSSIVHAAAARKLRGQLEAGHTQLSELIPPESLVDAHQAYLNGLTLEMTALDDMLEFYSSFSTQVANRAALRMDEASRQLTLAQVTFSQRRVQVNQVVAQQTAR